VNKSKIYWILLPLLISVAETYDCNAQRQVGVVFDNSGSMAGNPCVYTNYSLKMFIALFESDSYKLWVTRQDDTNPFRVDLQSRIKEIDKVDWQCGGGGIYWESLSKTINEFNLTAGKDAWLVIVSDGLIDFDLGDNHKKLKDYAANGGKILWVNTTVFRNFLGNGLSRFLKMSVPKSQVTVFGAESGSSDLLENLAKAAALLINADPLGIKQSISGNELRIKLGLPARKLVIIEQNSLSRNTAEIQSISNDQQSRFSNYYSIPFHYDFLYGRITHLMKNQGTTAIPSGDYILKFNENIEGRDIKVLPIVLVKPSIKLKGNFNSIKNNIYRTCKDENNIIISIEFSDDSGMPLGDDFLSQLSVTARFGDKQKKLTRKGKAFEGQVPLEEEETSLTIESSLKGYFTFESEVYKILKEECDKKVQKTDSSRTNILTRWLRRSPSKSDKINKTSDDAVKPGMQKSDSGKIMLNLDHPAVRITDLENAPSIQVFPLINDQPVTFEEYPDLTLYQIDESGLRMKIERQKEFWLVKPHKMTCSCLAKTGTYTIQFEMRSKTPGLYPTQSTTIDYELLDAPFWEKCGRFILKIFLALLTILYLWGIIRKNRFTPAAEIYYARLEVNETGEINWRKVFLRKRGLIKWIARWLVPYLPEKSFFNWYHFRAGFIAADSKYSIIYPRSLQNDHTFYCSSKLLDPGKEDLFVSENQVLEIRRDNYRIIMKYISNKK
jgi:hypothetical protein